MGEMANYKGEKLETTSKRTTLDAYQKSELKWQTKHVKSWPF